MKHTGVLFKLHYWIAFITVLLCSVGSATADYCSSNGNIVSYEWIGGITVGDYSRYSGSNGGYADYTSDIVQLVPGANNVMLMPGFSSSSYTEYWCLWIDLNHDEVFSSDERLYAGASRAAITTEIQVPVSSLSGQTRMRISMRYGSSPSPCGSFTYGKWKTTPSILPGTRPARRWC